jgi:murein DD-endopeptidase MepM/ murein hydrolase activator NlpD
MVLSRPGDMSSHSIAVQRGRKSPITLLVALVTGLGGGCSKDPQSQPRGSHADIGLQPEPAARTTDAPEQATDGPTTAAGNGSNHPPRSQADVSEAEGVRVEGAIAQGDSLSRVFHRAGLDAREIHGLTLALSAVMDPEKVRVGQRYGLSLREDGTFDTFTLALTPVLEVRVERDEEGKLEAKKTELETEIRIEEIGGRVERSLYASITAGGEHASLVGFLVGVFEYDINFFTDTRAGDMFKIIVEKELVDGEFVGYRHLLAAEYAGQVGTYRAFWWNPKGGRRGRYVDGQGRGIARTLLKTPLKFTRVSSEFDRRRMHPVLHRTKGHYGVDYAAPRGTPVRAAASGKITVRERRKGAGNLVIISHDHGMKTVYMHLDKFRKGQAVGQQVGQKTVIGYVGSTGLSTGPHLHFGVKIAGQYVDPQKVKMKRGPGVSRQDRRQFKRHAAKLGKRLEAISTR